MRVFSVGVALLVSYLSYGQVLTGRVLDQSDRSPLLGAVLTLDSGDGDISSENGSYEISVEKPGRYQLTISYLGYKRKIVRDILLKSNRVSQLDIALEVAPVSLGEVTIQDVEPFQVGGKRTISEDQIYRFASTYYDPARIMTTSADVVIANDQNNQISIRGLSPNYNVWRLEDVEIINPNHLSNAGSITDQPNGTGGGVNAISAQILGRSSLYYGAMESGLSNSVGGIFDMRLREGNNQEFQYTAQASLIGFDLMTEGPIGKNTSVLANYRYSFTGLLAGFGVDFGGESIGYQDISLVTHTNFNNGSKLKLFVTGGNNYNYFEHTGYENAERQKDLSDIDFEGKLGLAGFRYDMQSWSLSYATSGSFESRNQTNYDASDQAFESYNTETGRALQSGLLQKNFKLRNASINAQAGFNTYRFSYDAFVIDFGQTDSWSQSLMHGGVDWDQYLGKRWLLQTGGKYYFSNQESRLDYRAKLNFIFNQNSVYLAAGKYSQLLNPTNRYFDERVSLDFAIAQENEFIISDRFLTGLDWQLAGWQGNIEGFLYQFDDVKTLYSDKSTAETMGVSVSIEKNSSTGWYLLAGGALFNSTYADQLNNRYNSRTNGSFLVGKEIKLNTDNTKRLEFNFRQTYQGGNWYVASANDAYYSDFPITFPVEDKTQTDPYLRLDFRVQYTKSKRKSTSTWSLDIQNLLNRENQSFQYFDTFLLENVNATQLGMIPNITYRIDF